MFPGNNRAHDARNWTEIEISRSAEPRTPKGSQLVAGVSPQATTGNAATSQSTPAGVAARNIMLVALLAMSLGACRQKMADQPSYNPLESSNFYADGMSARPRIEGTVARGEISDNPFFDTGRVNGKPGDGYPMPITAAVIDRGEERFNIYCSQCHGRVGDGNGMIAARGFRRPPSFHTDKLRTATTGHFFDVMTNGFGAMPPYKTMIPTQDRWAIVAYIRALQLSQNATVADVPAAERASLDAPAAAAAPAHGGQH